MTQSHPSTSYAVAHAMEHLRRIDESQGKPHTEPFHTHSRGRSYTIDEYEIIHPSCCPLCKRKLANGWWCLYCDLTRKQAERVRCQEIRWHRLVHPRETFAQRFFGTLVLLAFGILFITLISFAIHERTHHAERPTARQHDDERQPP